MLEVNKLEFDGISYIEIARIDKYIFFVNENDEKDIFIQRLIKKNNKEYLEGISNEEYNKALLIFKENYEKLIY